MDVGKVPDKFDRIAIGKVPLGQLAHAVVDGVHILGQLLIGEVHPIDQIAELIVCLIGKLRLQVALGQLLHRFLHHAHSAGDVPGGAQSDDHSDHQRCCKDHKAADGPDHDDLDHVVLMDHGIVVRSGVDLLGDRHQTVQRGRAFRQHDLLGFFQVSLVDLGNGPVGNGKPAVERRFILLCQTILRAVGLLENGDLLLDRIQRLVDPLLHLAALAGVVCQQHFPQVPRCYVDLNAAGFDGSIRRQDLVDEFMGGAFGGCQP